jgi:hypothetical protein
VIPVQMERDKGRDREGCHVAGFYRSKQKRTSEIYGSKLAASNRTKRLQSWKYGTSEHLSL